MSQHEATYVISYHGILRHDMSYIMTIPASLVGRITEGCPETVKWGRDQVRQMYKGSYILCHCQKLVHCLSDGSAWGVLFRGKRARRDKLDAVRDIHKSTLIKQQLATYAPFAVREVAQQLDTMIAAGVKQPSQSPWASPVVLVKKKDGTCLFCVEYHSLNAVTKAETYPLPRIDDLLYQLSHAKFFSTLDLAAGH